MTETLNILIVDDTLDTLEILRRNLQGRGYGVKTANSVALALAMLEDQIFDLTLTDIKMPDQDGFVLLRHIRENYRDMEVLVITGYPQIKDAIRAVKLGAVDYLVKPFTDDELFLAVDQAQKKLALRRQSETGPLPTPHGFIGQSAAMTQLYREIHKVARSSAPVLILGESGSGKEMAARAIHYQSKRASAPFVPVNCGAIPEQLMESEFFGHVKGAFTGAIGARSGFFQTAEKGTILLDEIGEASPSLQVKLLRAIQEGEVVMVGSTKPRKVDVRILAATNKDLFTLVNKDAFREDLYYRLNVLTIKVPPLRERRDDIGLLINHFIGKFSNLRHGRTPMLSEKAIEVLVRHPWPGNVRELENVILRIVTMAEGDYIDLPDLPSHMRYSAALEKDLTRTLAEVERQYIRDVLANVQGNKTLAAKILDIDRKTLRDKL